MQAGSHLTQRDDILSLSIVKGQSTNHETWQQDPATIQAAHARNNTALPQKRRPDAITFNEKGASKDNRAIVSTAFA